MPESSTQDSLKKGLIPQVRHAIPVASGKGGVGKSTVSANLAVALAKQGATVGLMDADVYGPSIPTIFGVTAKPQQTAGRVLPVEAHGVKLISMGFFVPSNEAVIWRGPMLHKMVNDFLSIVDWGGLDYLIVDLPPGTGDIQLSLCQTIPVTGAVIVSTPQDVAWNVAQKAIMMFDKLNAPIIGVIENMTGEVFGKGGARNAAARLEIPFLGEIPLARALRESADKGTPIVAADPAGEVAKTFFTIARNLAAETARVRERKDAKAFPAKISPAGAERVEIEWSDGRKSSYDPRELRLACPCAACVDEVTGQRQLKIEWLKPDTRASSITPVGRYALHIAWSDGHNTGLYGFDYLRKLG